MSSRQHRQIRHTSDPAPESVAISFDEGDIQQFAQLLG
jgi:hypothetical protein